ncbi:MAG: response regulator transcription factor [Eggerthellaceae bacterium]|nr:response regulator transcription factor [Eggerthellaceae bacterium]
MIDVVLADDHSVVRMGFRMIIEQQMDLRVVGEASDPGTAVDLVVKHKPDVLLSDISMGTEKSGLLLAERIRDAGLPTRVVILSMHDEQEYLSQALKAGALGYVLKSSSDAELLKAIRRAADDESYVCDDMMDGFVRNSVSRTDPAADALSPREAELVSLAVRGYSNQEIAEALAISVKTVENRKAKVMAKIGAHSRPELFDYAVKHGLVKL